MPRPSAAALLVVVALVVAASGCSRLTFVKPDAKRKGPQETARTYSVSDSPATKRRLAANDRLIRGTQRLQSGDFAAAEKEAAAVIRDNPESADAHTLMAVSKDRQGDQVAAGRYYQRAAELAPAQGAALNNHGTWLCNNGFPAESLVWFDRALAAPGYATPSSALANAGGCALRSGQLARAERDLRQALELEPGNAYALASMAESEFRQDRFMAARAFSERRLAAAPATADVLQLASQIEHRLGDKAAASRYVQRLRVEFPEAAVANPGGITGP